LNKEMSPRRLVSYTCIRGLRPKDKVAACFASYGWGGGAVRETEGVLKNTGIKMITRSVKVSSRLQSKKPEEHSGLKTI